jgi:hypothetical protein
MNERDWSSMLAVKGMGGVERWEGKTEKTPAEEYLVTTSSLREPPGCGLGLQLCPLDIRCRGDFRKESPSGGLGSCWAGTVALHLAEGEPRHSGTVYCETPDSGQDSSRASLPHFCV